MHLRIFLPTVIPHSVYLNKVFFINCLFDQHLIHMWPCFTAYTLTHYVLTVVALWPERDWSPGGGRGLKLVVPKTSRMFALLPLVSGSD